MIFSIINDYIYALIICDLKKKGNIIGAKTALISSIAINLGLLIFFKYSDFIILNINYLCSMNLSKLNLLLPIGISFYTFQTMSYTIDVYKGKVEVQNNLVTLGTYVVLFPQLIAGPIVRYETVEKELKDRTVSLDDIYTGLSRFIIGLGKKIIIANQVALIADKIFKINIKDIGLEIAWIGIIAYTLQIYFDFSGYSDMAIGLGRIFGFTFLENFNYPYISQSITEFWRRWHISLGSWFRDYVYIPLGGNRVKVLRWILNIFIVWFLTGLWHGASWNFIIWGLYYGVILIIEKEIIIRLKISLPTAVKHIYTLFMIMIGWVIFRTETLIEAKNYIIALFGGYGHSNFILFHSLSIVGSMVFIILGIIGSTPLIKNLFNKLNRYFIPSLIYDICLIIIFLGSLLFLINRSFNPFIYFRF
jgi:alginate O-acetyltransferase complex protein AlgI